MMKLEHDVELAALTTLELGGRARYFVRALSEKDVVDALDFASEHGVRDKDKVQDEDGCPEDDADKDGIPDVQDKCPTEPGKRSPLAEKFGCPSNLDFSEDGSFKLLKPIEFETGRAQIKAVSFPILDEVLDLMKSRPSIKIGVYGHTDSKGTAPNNLRLSKERAAAVRNYLQGKGVAANRLESEGFGQTKPVSSNDTDEGRAKNRRVEFKILSGE